MTYFESAENEIISYKRTKQEVENHGVDWQEFLDEYGSQEIYSAQSVLIWLGY